MSTRKFILGILGGAAGVAALVALAVGALWALNPVGDEWICSDGEAPAGLAPSYNHCARVGSELPEGESWDPYGNRPMPYNCDKDGWMAVTRPSTYTASIEPEDDCVREGTTLPEGWHPRTDD